MTLDTPKWLMERWAAAYGEPTARAVAAAHANEPALDLTVKNDPALWAERLGGWIMPTGSVRLTAHGTVTGLPGFAEGVWWVQDAAAALPVRLLGDVAGRRVADLCAAPGGKAAQLAAAGAKVTAVDRSPARLARLAENLKRLSLSPSSFAPTPPNGMRHRSMRCWSMRPAPRPARSGAIPTCRGSSSRPTSKSSPACSAG